MMRLLVLLLAACLLAGTARADEKLHIFAAGSLGAPFATMMPAFEAQPGVPTDSIAPPVFGPSGVLREKIEAGAPADIFASADMANPARLAATRPGLTVVPFVRNRLCVQGMQKLGLKPSNLLARMLDPKLVLATSTPHADPGGDYAWAVFARADAVRPGSRAILEAKAKTLVGGPGMTPAVPGHGAVAGVFLTGTADLFLGYCSNVAAMVKEVPGLVSVPLPPPLAPTGDARPVYGMVVLTTSPLARRFAAFVLSRQGQAILAHDGFTPIATH